MGLQLLGSQVAIDVMGEVVAHLYIPWYTAHGGPI